jgi:ATP-dependent DNA helicase RecG
VLPPPQPTAILWVVLDDAELTRLASDLESDRVERKRNAKDVDKISEAICAFANDLPGHGAPGVLFVGIENDGSCANLAVTDELLLSLSDRRSDGNIVPLPEISVRRWRHGTCEVAVVEVLPSRSPPVRYKGRVCVRVGPRRAYASADEERRLNERRRGHDLPFDARAVPSASLADLDLVRFEQEYLPLAVAPDVLAENGRPREQQLTSLRFATTDGTPSVTGILAIGRDPRAFIPGAYVEFLRIAGADLTAPIQDEKLLGGTLGDQVRALDTLLDLNVRTSVDIVGADVEQRRADYPKRALQQLLRNAVMHRNYETSNAPVRVYWFEDKIEIHSPGGPFGQVSIERFGTPGLTDYRNPGVAEVLRVLGFVQRFGVGIATARKLLAANGNPPLEYAVTEANVVATVRARA